MKFSLHRRTKLSQHTALWNDRAGNGLDHSLVARSSDGRGLALALSQDEMLTVALVAQGLERRTWRLPAGRELCLGDPRPGEKLGAVRSLRLALEAGLVLFTEAAPGGEDGYDEAFAEGSRRQWCWDLRTGELRALNWQALLGRAADAELELLHAAFRPDGLLWVLVAPLRGHSDRAQRHRQLDLALVDLRTHKVLSSATFTCPTHEARVLALRARELVIMPLGNHPRALVRGTEPQGLRLWQAGPVHGTALSVTPCKGPIADEKSVELQVPLGESPSLGKHWFGAQRALWSYEPATQVWESQRLSRRHRACLDGRGLVLEDRLVWLDLENQALGLVGLRASTRSACSQPGGGEQLGALCEAMMSAMTDDDSGYVLPRSLVLAWESKGPAVVSFEARPTGLYARIWSARTA